MSVFFKYIHVKILIVAYYDMRASGFLITTISNWNSFQLDWALISPRSPDNIDQ